MCVHIIVHNCCTQHSTEQFFPLHLLTAVLKLSLGDMESPDAVNTKQLVLKEI